MTETSAAVRPFRDASPLCTITLEHQLYKRAQECIILGSVPGQIQLTH